MELALVASRLEAAAAAAPPLSHAAAALLVGQLRAGPALPAFPVLAAALGVCRQRTRSPPAEARLPRRVLAEAGEQAALREPSLWRAYYEASLHEVLTDEMLAALASHVRAALPAAGRDGGLPVVLECGAGSGALSHRLRALLGREARVVAADDHSARIDHSAFEVAPLGAAAAIEAYRPDVCLVSWMPSGVDWTAEMRAAPSVRSYVLLGEADSSTCGDAWATWGVLPPNAHEYALDADTPPPYATEGFARAELDEVSEWQLCRFDSTVARGFSRAVSFVRREAGAV